jgi:hypothetical protein
MKITYIGPSEDLDIGVAYVERGGTVDVPDEIAASLIESGDFIAEAKASKTKPEEATS